MAGNVGMCFTVKTNLHLSCDWGSLRRDFSYDNLFRLRSGSLSPLPVSAMRAQPLLGGALEGGSGAEAGRGRACVR